jgi:hypothetical protein
MVLRNNRGEISSGKTIGAIIAILLILVVVGVVVENNPNWLYKLIPDAGKVYDQDEEIKVPEGTIANPCTSDGKVVVGRILSGEIIQVRKIGQDEKIFLQSYQYLLGSSNSLKWLASEEKIYHDPKSGFDVTLGNVVNGNIAILPTYLKQDTPFYLELLFEGVTFNTKDLAILDGAQMKESYFCKFEKDYISSKYIEPWPTGTSVSLIDLVSVTPRAYSSSVLNSVPAPNELDLSPYLSFVAKEDKYVSSDLIYIVPKNDADYLEMYLLRDGKKTSPIGIISPDGFVWLIVPKTYYEDGVRKIMTNDYLSKSGNSLSFYQKNMIFWIIPWPGTTLKSSGWKLSNEVKFNFQDYAGSSYAYVKSNIKLNYSYIKNNP